MSSQHTATTEVNVDLEKSISKTHVDAVQLETSGTSPVYPKGIKLYLICVTLLLSNLLVALDQTVITAAVPVIANDFKKLNDVGWYASAYLLTGAATQPVWGRAYGYFSQKWMFFSAVATFMVGSLICAVSKDSKTFIVGRAIAGTGFGGIYIGVVSIMTTVLPLELQAIFQALVGASYGLGATTGPIIGGALTSRTTWRWCFYLNLPIGGVTLPLIALFLNQQQPPQSKTVTERLKSLDWTGTVVLLGSFVCILLALQDGGIASAWKSGRSIGLVVGFIVLLALYFVIQYYEGENASINLRLLRKRSIAMAGLANFTTGASYFGMLYYLPIYFQAVRGSSPIRSGVEVLPFICVGIFTVIVAGAFVDKTGNFNIPLLVGTCIGAIGCGLCSLFNAGTGMGEWVGLQILGGFCGMAFMMPLMACQALTSLEDRPAGSTIAIFSQTLGATLLVSVFQSIYQNKLLEGIRQIPGIDIQQVVGSGVSAFREAVPADLLPLVIDVAARALHDVFIGTAVVLAIGFVAGSLIEWKKVNAEDIQAAF